jgi:hypothetical protein
MRPFDPPETGDAARDAVAIEIDIAAGVLDACPICRDISDRQHDDRLPSAEHLAHQRFDRHDPSVAVYAGDRGDLLRRLRAVRKRFGYNCRCMDAG